MRAILRLGVTIIGLAVLTACADQNRPAGRWQGFFEGGDAMIAVRLEIAANGAVRVSAPNAFMNFAAMPEERRADMRTSLASKLAEVWPNVGTTPLTFDGKVFRKPGGVAPQLEWDAGRKRMTLIVYPGVHATIRVPLAAVREFAPAPS